MKPRPPYFCGRCGRRTNRRNRWVCHSCGPQTAIYRGVGPGQALPPAGRTNAQDDIRD